MRGLGELEAVVMGRLWLWGRSCTVREVLEDLQRDRPVAYTTVMTVMDNLHRKGVLDRRMDGRAYRYVPVRSRAEYTADLIADALGPSGDRTAPLLHFAEQLSPAEIGRLRGALDMITARRAQRRGGGGPG